MFGWVAKKSQNSRVYMCTKEVKWDLEMADVQRRATILALSQFFRVSMFEGSGIPMDVLDRPIDYSRSDLMRFYNGLEDIRNVQNHQLTSLQKNTRQFGFELPQFAIDHAKNTSRALEVWMCTLSAGIAPERRGESRAIWAMMIASSDALQAAIEYLRNVETQTAELSGMPAVGMFSEVSDQEWASWCNFVPSIFQKELKGL